MKPFKSILPLVCASTLLLNLTGCKRSIDEDIELDLDTSIIKVDAEVEVTNLDIDNIADQAEILETVTKKTDDVDDILTNITVKKDTTTGSGVDTIRIEVDFGTQDNLGLDGKKRRGIIKIQNLINNTGVREKREIKTENYYFEGHKIELIREHVFESVDVASQTYTWRVETDLTIQHADGQTSNRQSDRKYILMEGSTTPNDFSDDKWKIEGSDEGTRKDGKTYTTQIIEPLYKYTSCKYIEQGKIEYAVDGASNFTMDYGAGSGCDNKVDIVAEGRTEVVELD